MRFFGAPNTVRQAACRARRGVALVAVLSVLTVLAILAMAFAVLTNIEQASSAVSFYGMDAQALAEAGLEHAKAVLWSDAMYDPTHSDGDGDIWITSFNGRQAQHAPDANVTPNNDTNANDAVWIPVRDTRNRLIGRYAVVVQDECAKLNLNTACIAPPNLPNEGLSPREGLLGNGKNSGLPFSSAALTRLLAYKYGPNGVPGARDDDNHNNAFLMADGLDNNANGVVDELDEGINEPDEYVPQAPFGDDRVFYSLQEAWGVLAPDTPPTARRVAFLRQYATLHSQDNNLRWDDAQRAWVPRQNVNVCGARDVLRTLGQANRQYAFEGSQRMLRRIATATVDYRDENDVLSTAGSEYGVEAVCFNEILANEGSRIRQTYYVQNFRDNDIRVHNLAYLYGDYDYRKNTPYQGDSLDQIRTREKGHQETAWFIDFNPPPKPVGNQLLLRLDTKPRNTAGYFESVSDFKKLLRTRNTGLSGDRIIWPENFWANGFLTAFTSDLVGKGTFPILRSTDTGELYLDTRTMTPQNWLGFTTDVNSIRYSYAQLRSWTFEKAYYAEHPNVKNWFICSGLQPDKYYRVYLQETNLETPTGDTSGGQRLCEDLDVDGNVTAGNEQRMRRLRYAYKDGQAIRADRAGCIDVYVASSSKCSPMRRNRVNAIYFARPDIIELMNISDRPISLRGWSLVANTGSIAYELGMINRATAYLRDEHGRGQDENPVIRPNEYFYLCNNMEIFDYDYGRNKNGVWGNSNDEQMPVYEISDDTWGMRFKIQRIREVGGSGTGQSGDSFLTCDNEAWIPHQFKDEVVEFQTSRRSSQGMSTSPDGVRALIYDNTRNTLQFQSLLLKQYSDVREGDSIMIVGLPRIGGFVSMTLKNEYGQIAARVTKYGNPSRDATRDQKTWLNWSAEKPNPTREEWVLTSTPSIGGTVQAARNRAAVVGQGLNVSIKNGPLGSIGELRRVRSLAAWEQEDNTRQSATINNLLRGAAEYCDTMGMRLDVEEPGAHLAGWRPAFGEATLSDTRGVMDHTAMWQINCWSNQSLTIMSGKNRGETFAIEANGQNRLQVVGRSVPSRATFFVRSGDQYSLGPGYASALYYTRKAEDEGEWEWKDKRIPPGHYQCYLVGLNDSIRTTEFLEENYNPRMDISLYNFTTSTYDLIGRNKQYDKSDTVYAGEVLPQHLSSSGGLRVKVVPKGLGSQYCSGFAWFDHVFLTPVPVAGRINVNTASERILMTLGGMDQTIAHNIAYGIDTAGQPRLKPYCTIGDVLAVRGMTPEVFTKMANLVTVRSYQYNIYVLAQRVRDADGDGVFDPTRGDKVESQVRLRALLDRGGIAAQSAEKPLFRALDRDRF